MQASHWSVTFTNHKSCAPFAEMSKVAVDSIHKKGLVDFIFVWIINIRKKTQTTIPVYMHTITSHCANIPNSGNLP